MQIKFFKKKNNYQKESLSPNVGLYWKLAVCFIFLVIFALLFFGYVFFKKINLEPVFSNSGNKQVETIKKDRIDKVLEYFSIRETISDQTINSLAPVIDPSF